MQSQKSLQKSQKVEFYQMHHFERLKILAWKVKKVKILHIEVRKVKVSPQSISQRSKKCRKVNFVSSKSHKSKKSVPPSRPPIRAAIKLSALRLGI